ncbi:MAG: hypothetical protein M3O36_09175 [Myxococcota bacterium]|nr:hypothetical protein [Myxococcota bacterium]
MTELLESSCCVCGANDARALIHVVLEGGAHVTLCGTHAVILRRSSAQPLVTSPDQLRGLLRDRRDRGERRTEGDELAAALAAAFQPDRRENERRRA